MYLRKFTMWFCPSYSECISMHGHTRKRRGARESGRPCPPYTGGSGEWPSMHAMHGNACLQKNAISMPACTFLVFLVLSMSEDASHRRSEKESRKWLTLQEREKQKTGVSTRKRPSKKSTPLGVYDSTGPIQTHADQPQSEAAWHQF